MTLPAGTAAGWARLRGRLERDGALSAHTKALLLAAVAATRGRQALLARELARLSDTDARGEIASLVGIVTLARGREAASLLAAGADFALDWPAPDASTPSAPQVAEALAYLAPQGAPPAPVSPPAPVALLAAHVPDVLVGYRELRGGVYESSALDGRTVELTLLAISAAGYQQAHAAIHAGKALALGADEAQLVEAGLCAVPSAGMGAWLIAAGAIASVGTARSPDVSAAERLLAEAEIRAVICRYGQGVDSRDYEQVKACYHPDAVHERGEFKGSGDEVIEWIRSIRETLVHCWHLTGYPLIERLDGDRAEVETYCLANQRLPAKPGRPAVDRLTPCRYRDTFTRVDGRWRIAVRRALYLPAQELPVSEDVVSPDSFAGG